MNSTPQNMQQSVLKQLEDQYGLLGNCAEELKSILVAIDSGKYDSHLEALLSNSGPVPPPYRIACKNCKFPVKPVLIHNIPVVGSRTTQIPSTAPVSVTTTTASTVSIPDTAAPVAKAEPTSALVPTGGAAKKATSTPATPVLVTAPRVTRTAAASASASSSSTPGTPMQTKSPATALATATPPVMSTRASRSESNPSNAPAPVNSTAPVTRKRGISDAPAPEVASPAPPRRSSRTK